MTQLFPKRIPPCLALMLFIAGACASESGFNGDSSKKRPSSDTVADSKSTQNSQDTLADAGQGQNGLEADGSNSSECVDPEAALYKFPKEIQDCMDQGFIWDYSRSQCSPIEKASFACTYESLLAAIESQGNGKPQAIVNAHEKGAVFTACGEKDDGRMIIAQWVVSHQLGDTCEPKKVEAIPVTGCYRHMLNPPVLQTPEEVETFVAECLAS